MDALMNHVEDAFSYPTTPRSWLAINPIKSYSQIDKKCIFLGDRYFVKICLSRALF
jgi:hypothetical protein